MCFLVFSRVFVFFLISGDFLEFFLNKIVYFRNFKEIFQTLYGFSRA